MSHARGAWKHTSDYVQVLCYLYAKHRARVCSGTRPFMRDPAKGVSRGQKLAVDSLTRLCALRSLGRKGPFSNLHQAAMWVGRGLVFACVVVQSLWALQWGKKKVWCKSQHCRMLPQHGDLEEAELPHLQREPSKQYLPSCLLVSFQQGHSYQGLAQCLA